MLNVVIRGVGTEEMFTTRLWADPVQIFKYNMNHDPKTGRFTTGRSGAASGDAGGGSSTFSASDATELLKAYADAHMDMSNRASEEQAYKDRNLDFLSKGKLPPKDMESFVRDAMPDGYNAFSVKRVFNVLNQFPDVKVQVAREGSPALYIHGSKETLSSILKLHKKMRADEANIYEKDIRSFHGAEGYKTKMTASPEKPVLRLWWD